MIFLRDSIELFISRFDFFLELIIEHILISLVAIMIAGILGVFIGITMVFHKKIASFFLTLTSFLYTIPSIAMFGLLVMFTGIGNTSAIIALVLYALLPIIRNTYVGILEVDKDIIEAAKGMGSTRKQLLFKIQLPLATPYIFTGFRTMVIMTIALAGIASFIGAGGLGVAIYRGITTYYQEMIFIGSLLVAILAYVVDSILGVLEKKIRFKILGKVN